MLSLATDLSRTPLESLWSASVRHSVQIDPDRRSMFLRRWDQPEHMRLFQLPTRPSGTAALLALIEKQDPPTLPDAVAHTLRAFRAIRAAYPIEESLPAVRLFNVLLLTAQAVRDGRLEPSALASLSTAKELVGLLTTAAVIDDLIAWAIDADAIAGRSLTAPITDLLAPFVHPEPYNSYILQPHLLLRHAAGHLYQEAHLILERQAQLSLPGFPNLAPPQGAPCAGVRFTPPTLARALVQRALDALGAALPESLEVLDPACGSGVFLTEVTRELIARGFVGRLRLRGIDLSDVSCAMSRFALCEAQRDAEGAGISVVLEVSQQDSLETDWGTPDIVLMNPPFIQWRAMTEAERTAVRGVLGVAAKGRTDMAMAFVLRGAKSLRPGGVAASVLPSPLLESSHGVAWREELAQLAHVRLIGRFEGYGYFRASIVEPAFVVLQRRTQDTTPASTTLLVAGEGAEDSALRALRGATAVPPRRGAGGGETARWEVFEQAEASLTSSSWLVRAGEERRFQQFVEATSLSLARDLFDIRQGALTGDNRAFLLGRKDYLRLPKAERAFFRPAVGNRTVEGGRLLEVEHVFFPYKEKGLEFESEAAVRTAMPQYYKTYLRPRREFLIRRAGVKAQSWWTLTGERRWQRRHEPKLVSTYFGGTGSFGLDEAGKYGRAAGCE